LPAVAPEKVETVLAKFGHFDTVKIKVAEAGQTIEDDLARVAEVRRRYPHAKIRLDANGGYSLEIARAMAAAMAEDEVPLEYFEQPVASVAEMAQLRMLIAPLDIKIAADENVRKAADPLEVARMGAADILVLKAAPLGGISRALEITEQAGLPVVVSSALDSSIGISMGAHLAGALADLSFDCGLGTANLLAGDVTLKPIVAVDGQLEIRRPEVDRSRLEIFGADDHRADWWFSRLERVMQLRESR
jgi:O-succinylbenzoate synthase